MKKQYLNNFVPTQGENLWSDDKQENTIYREYLPCKELRPYIACYWLSKIKNISREPISSKIIPDGCIDIVFNMEAINRGGSGEICGLMTMPQEEKVKRTKEFIGIRFWPGGIMPFLNNAACDFTDNLVALDSVLGADAFYIAEQIYTSASLGDRIMIIERELLKLLLRAGPSDELIKNALYTVYKHKGALSIKNLSKEIHISQRQLSRKFKTWIGTNPKTFLNIIRFQHIIKELNESKHINLQDLALESGYYDQAHFIKAFKSLYGKTPGEL